MTGPPRTYGHVVRTSLSRPPTTAPCWRFVARIANTGWRGVSGAGGLYGSGRVGIIGDVRSSASPSARPAGRRTTPDCFPHRFDHLGELVVPAIRYPTRYRTMPHGPQEFAAFHAECSALFAHATELDAQQREIAVALGNVRTKLAEMRVVMWPRVEPRDIVHGFRVTRRGGPPPIPPAAPNGTSPARQAPALDRARRPRSQPASDDARRDPSGAAPERLRDRVTPPGQAARRRARLRDRARSGAAYRARRVRARPAQPGHAAAHRADPVTARARPRPSTRRPRWGSSRPAHRPLRGPPSWPGRCPSNRRRSRPRDPSSCRAAPSPPRCS